MEITASENFNAVQKITQIAKKLEDSAISDEVMVEIKDDLEGLSEYLEATPQQSMLFFIIFGLQTKMFNVDMSDIILFLGINCLDALNFKNDLNILLKKSYIETDCPKGRYGGHSFGKANSFTISTFVSDQIYASKPIQKKKDELLDIFGFVKEVSDLIKKREDEGIDTEGLFLSVEELEQKNSHLIPLGKIEPLLGIEDRTLLYEIVDDNINYEAPSNLDKTLNDIYDNTKVRRGKSKELIERTSKLCELEYVEVEEARFANDFILQLTNKGIEVFMQEDADLFFKNKKVKSLLAYGDITQKELFYDTTLAEEVSFLTQSLMNDRFTALQERLSNMNLAKGVASIFYGLPGTGKTETAYQIAKATSRDVFMVDISQTKSMWFGESEKKVKEIFNSYRRLCKTMPVSPILLFNEADAILNKRHTNSNSNVGQTENAIQNILLDELERFEGILIATTNLQGNLDAAYERRFLFKVKFDKPSVEVKSKIWLNKLNGIDEAFAIRLAKSFDFSGGEIDNIVRKITMKEVLTSVRPSNDEIFGFCKTEKLLSVKDLKKVGFLQS